MGSTSDSCERAAAQSVDWGSDQEREIRFLVVHGVLHLLGWDDATTEERERMLADLRLMGEEVIPAIHPYIAIAPEGTRQKTGLARPKEGLTYVATKANAVIVPTAISGAACSRKKNATRSPLTNGTGRRIRFRS